MVKFSLSYLAGVLSAAGIVYFAGTRTSAAMFVLGIVFTLAAIAAALGSKDRIRDAGNLLLAIAGTKNPSRMPRPAQTTALEPLTDTEGQVISALKNMGSSHAAASRATIAVSRATPGLDFDELFRAALNSAELKRKASAR